MMMMMMTMMMMMMMIDEQLLLYVTYSKNSEVTMSVTLNVLGPTNILNGMTYYWDNWPILSANKIAQQKSVVRHAVIDCLCRLIKLSEFIVQHWTRFIHDDKLGQLFAYQSTDFV